MNIMAKKLIFLGLAALMFGVSLLAHASEVTGTLSTGITTGVTGVVIVLPTASPVAGTYTSVQQVVLAAAGSSNIHYTVDGTVPTCTGGQTYSGPVSISVSKTLKALSCYPNNQFSGVASFVYVINLTIGTADLPSLLSLNALDVPDGEATTSTPSVQATQNITLQVAMGGGTSTVSIPSGTMITTTSGANFNATALVASEPSSGTISNLGSGTVVDGALQWGIPNLGLQFSSPITLSIFVGTSFNGATLNVKRSVTGGGDWTDDGIVSPATCVVSNGLCMFSATKASYYVAFTTTPPPSSPGGGGGGGGGGGTSPTPTPTPTPSKSGDTNNDGKIDILDFNVLMVNWGQHVSGAAHGDLNNDGTVDILDFNMLMVAWTL